LIFAHDWADWEQTKRSYELIARYVMPHFNDGFAARRAAYDYNLQNRDLQLTELEKGKPINNGLDQQPNVRKFAQKVGRAIRRFGSVFGSR
jgi:hypothetical protein